MEAAIIQINWPLSFGLYEPGRVLYPGLCDEPLCFGTVHAPDLGSSPHVQQFTSHARYGRGIPSTYYCSQRPPINMPPDGENKGNLGWKGANDDSEDSRGPLD